MNSGDTAWILACSALVLLMTPGVAFFYGGLVRRTNAAATIMHSFMTIGIVGVVWVLWGWLLRVAPWPFLRPGVVWGVGLVGPWRCGRPSGRVACGVCGVGVERLNVRYHSSRALS